MTLTDGLQPLTAATFEDHVAELATQDSAIGMVIDAYGVPDFWHRPPGFATMCLFIIEQQVSLASAKAVFDRVTAALGTVTPATVLEASDDTLGVAGVTRQKQRYIRLLAEAVSDGTFDLDGLATMPDAEARQQLLELTGVGPWTADVYLLSALRRPDIWPVGDRALQVGVGEVLATADVPTPDELEGLGMRWQPRRSVAARLVWHSYLCRRGRSEPEVAGLG